MLSNFKKVLSIILVIVLVVPTSILGVGAEASEGLGSSNHVSSNIELFGQFEGNMLENPSFETTEGWVFSSGAGYQSNNTHSGSKGFFLDGGTGNSVHQKIIVPYSGTYKTSGYIATGGGNSTFGIKNSEGTIITSLTLPQGANYTSAHNLDLVELTQGDEVSVYVAGGNSWTNGDDISFEYNMSDVTYNLLKNRDLTQSSIGVCLPRAGDYILSVVVNAATETTIEFGGSSNNAVVAAGATETVTLSGNVAAAGDLLTINVAGTATLSEASLIFDVSGIPNDPPSASNVAVGGELYSKVELMGSYDFVDPDPGQTEGMSTFRWLKSDGPAGTFEEIIGATTKTLPLDDIHENIYVKFEVTPVDSYGLAGTVETSLPVGPIEINWIRNTSMEIESSGNPVGWSTQNGASIPNSKANARTGFRVGRIPSGSLDGEVFYTANIEKTAVYNLSAWINLPNGESSLGIRLKGQSIPINSTVISSGAGYLQTALVGTPLEKGTQVEVFVKGNRGTSNLHLDDFVLTVDNAAPIPEFASLISIKAENQVKEAVVDNELKTVELFLGYGTDVSQVKVITEVSETATIAPVSNAVLDFSSPLSFTITNGSLTNTWTISVTVLDKIITLESDNQILQDGFNWATHKTGQFVMTDKTGPIDNGRSPDAAYMPSYWAGYYNRTAFYSRDFVHQATGAELVGLTEENYQMFKAFADSANVSRKWYALWALNFDGTAYYMDYHSDTNFVREVPAQFELVEKAYKQYLWSADPRYIDDDMFNFYTKVMTDYVELHDLNNPNGVAEGAGAGGIFAGAATYNERGDDPIEAGDSIGSQYQATLAYAGFLEARGDSLGASEWLEKAAELNRYFNEEWSVKSGETNYVRSIDLSGNRPTNFGKENSWFMPMKLITEPGERNDQYLEFIGEKLANGIGTGPEVPNNIEAYTYIPDMYFAYNRSEDAWKWMKYIISVKDNTHENTTQGTNGDYPEISFTHVSHVIEGLMGFEPDARTNSIASIPRLPSEVGYVKIDYLNLGSNELSLMHEGKAKSTIVSDASNAEITWTARFYGTYDRIEVNGQMMYAVNDTLNGEPISYVKVQVAPGKEVVAKAVASINKKSLGDLVTNSELLIESEHTSETWLPFIEALNNGKTVFLDIDAEQSDVDLAFSVLTTAKNNLIRWNESTAQRESLKKLVSIAKELVEANYTPNSWNVLNTAVLSANSILADGSATSQQIEAAYTALQNAIINLETVGDTTTIIIISKLTAAIVKAAGLNSSDYTTESWNKLEAALSTAISVLENSAPTQIEIDSATLALEKAIAELKTVTKPSTGGTSSSSSSSSSGGSNRQDSSPNIKGAESIASQASNTGKAVTKAEAEKAFNNAVSKLPEGAKSVTVTMQNVGNISGETYLALKQQAQAKGLELNLNLDTVINSRVVGRISFNSKYAGSKGFNGGIDQAQAKKIEKLFEKYFKNNLAVISLNQQGELEGTVGVAIKLPEGMNVANLVPYNYDATTNKYTKINTKPYVDKNGYLHFNTSIGGDIIISDGELLKK